MKKISLYKIFIMCMIIVLLTGCYSNIDLTDIAIATAIGFDRADGGDIKLTVQIAKPGVIKAKSKGSAEETVWVYSSTGETTFSALRNLLSTVNRKVFYSHLQLIVISEEMAEEGVLQVLDLLERDKEIQRLAYVIISKGISAEEVLKAKSELESIPAMHIKSTIDNYKSLAKMRKITFIDLLRDFNYSGTAATVGVIEDSMLNIIREKSEVQVGENEETDRKIQDSKNTLEKQTQSKEERELEIKDLHITGTAIFRRDGLAGYFDSFETRGLLFALDEVESGIINVDNPLSKGKKVAFEVFKSSTDLEVKIEEEKARLFIKVKANGKLADQQGAGDLTTPELIKKMEKDVARNIEKNISMAVVKSQEQYRLDIFGFSKLLYKEHEDYWKKVEDDWNYVYSRLPITIEVSWTTTSSSLIRQPSTAR